MADIPTQRIINALDGLYARLGGLMTVAEMDTITIAKERLKEQEAVKPILIREGRNKHYNDYVCPRCDNEVVYEQNYCTECGTQFLWEGR